MKQFPTETNRRDFLIAGAAGSALALGMSGVATAESSLTKREVEQANEKIVNDFCATFESMDVDKLSSFLADDVVFRMIDGAPFVEGKEALTQGIRDFLAPRTSARFEMIRTQSMGNIVINERIDHFGREDGDDAFHVVGVFLVKNGKIVEWRDYMMPAGA